MKTRPRIRRWGRLVRGSASMAAVSLSVALAGCTDAFGPGFLNLIDPTGSLASVDNSTGHVAIVFANNVTVDDQLLDYLLGPGGVELTPVELRELHPRIRFRVRITYAGGESVQNVVEFVSGSSKLVEDGFDSGLEPDLDSNDLTSIVVACNVDRIEIDGPIEVFVPATIEEWRIVVVEGGGGGVIGSQRPQPAGSLNENSLRFIPLQVDEVDQDFNIVRLRNLGTRDVPVPVEGPRCGSVVTFNVTGTLSVPFRFAESVRPSLLIEPPDEAAAARIGGRYSVRVELR